MKDILVNINHEIDELWDYLQDVLDSREKSSRLEGIKITQDLLMAAKTIIENDIAKYKDE